MQHQKQRKIKSSLSRRDPGVNVSPKLVGLFTILLLAFFFIYILVFHAVLHYNDEPVVAVPVAAAVPVVAVTDHKGAAETHVRERHVFETKYASTGKETLVLKTPEGDIKIVLLPSLSKESSDYIRAMAANAGLCNPCNLYETEKSAGILRGILTNKDIPVPKVKGTCPPGSEGVVNDCPYTNKNCRCHGPVMTRGMVAWAAGETGPDFFISNDERPALSLGTQHTVWGEIEDEDSLAIVNHIIMDLPTKHLGSLNYLEKPLHIEIAMEIDAPLPISEQVRERQVVETKNTETLVLRTKEGDIKIDLLPAFSKESSDYIRAIVADASHCTPCNLYRAEKPGILQGVLTNKNIPVPTAKGTCPQGSEGVANNCPKWDEKCGCHGPVMTRGLVAWAAGETGPDFFISNYEKPGVWWGTQHTGEFASAGIVTTVSSFQKYIV
jgi:hypothetical protein